MATRIHVPAGEFRLRLTRAAFDAYSLGVAFTFVTYALLKAVEDIADDSYEGVGHLVIGGVLLAGAVAKVSRTGAINLWLAVSGAVAILAGLLDLTITNVPWHVPMLIGAGIWIAAQRSQFAANQERPA